MSSIFRILFISDTHLGHDYPLKPRVKRERRGEDFFNNFKTAADYAFNNNFDFIFHGGDFFFRSRIPQKIIQMGNDLINVITSEYNIPLYIVPGNHERSKLPRLISSFNRNLYIFDIPKTYTVVKNELKISLTGFPYLKDNVRDNFSSILNKAGFFDVESDFKIIGTHHAVQGAKVGPQNFTFLNREDTIQIKDIPKETDMLLCGHIHRHQILNKRTGNKTIPIIFAGSAEKTSFAEIGEEKGFYILEIEKKNDSEIWKKIEFVQLTSRKMKILNIEKSFRTKKEFLIHLKECLSGFEKKSYVKINLQNTDFFNKLSSKEILDAVPKGMCIDISYNFKQLKNRKTGIFENGTEI